MKFIFVILLLALSSISYANAEDSAILSCIGETQLNRELRKLEIKYDRDNRSGTTVIEDIDSIRLLNVPSEIVFTNAGSRVIVHPEYLPTLIFAGTGGINIEWLGIDWSCQSYL